MDRITNAQIELVLINAIEKGREEIIPKRTRNMADNATLLARLSETSWEIYVSGDGENGIAPYAPFTNEPWLSPRWNGKPNPNEGWWGRFVEFVVKEVANALGARITVYMGD